MERSKINNVVKLPLSSEEQLKARAANREQAPTPKSDKVLENAEKLQKISKYQTDYDFEIYRRLEQRFGYNQPRGGVIFGANDPFKLINTHTTCQQCLYAFEMDTYGRGCVHNCEYCYSKVELTSHKYWNEPFPMPRDITTVWKAFYTVFETDKKSKWREILEQRIPLRIGSGSDGFMHMDKKYRVTHELLKLLRFYNYPYIIVTRSDLVAYDEYLEVLDQDLASVQISIPSLNDRLNKLIEPGAPSSVRRLNAVKKLTDNGFWTTVRINPLFPIYPDGYYSDPNFDDAKRQLSFDYFSYDIIKAIAEHGGQSILVGFVRLAGQSINRMAESTGVDLRNFFNKDSKRHVTLYQYSEREITAYYEKIHRLCKEQGIEFTTCYIGNGESFFWKHQNLWDNKTDCCNAKGRVKGFSIDSRHIKYETRIKLSSIKSSPNDKIGIQTPLGNLSVTQLKEREETTGKSNAEKE